MIYELLPYSENGKITFYLRSFFSIDEKNEPKKI